ncbi:MAG: DNA primase [Holosporales bacterium]|jgi:DNA primase|nr:DNA primase [Holosporales bacterium]
MLHDVIVIVSELNAALRRIKDRIPLSKIIGYDVILHKKGREFVGNCPFHNEKTASFFVNDEKGTFYCFGCGASGDVFEYLVKKRGIKFMSAVEQLAEMAGIKLPEKKFDNRFETHQRALQKTLDFFKDNLLSTEKAISYCSDRGITPELIEKFSIGYAPLNGDMLLIYLKKLKFSIEDILHSGVFIKKDNKLVCVFRDRIILPVLDKKGWPIAFGGRSLKKDIIPKYINSPESELFRKKETLYGYNIATRNVSKNRQFVVVEGYMDVIMMHGFGFNTTIASMGTSLSSDHLVKIWKYSDDPIICLDGDSAGYDAMVRVAGLAMPYLQPGKTLRFSQLMNNDDPDSFLRAHSKSEMEKLLSESDYLVDFLWKHFLKTFNTIERKTPEKIAKWKTEIFEYVGKIQNSDIKKLYQKEISNRIFNFLNVSNNLTNKKNFSKTQTDSSFFVDKNKKMLLREAVVLYIILERKSIISRVVEKLATVEFLDGNFEKLRSYIVQRYEFVDFNAPELQDVIGSVKSLVAGYCSCKSLDDTEVLNLWHTVFDHGIFKNRQIEDFEIAKSECRDKLTASTWNRLKALKIDSLVRNPKKSNLGY